MIICPVTPQYEAMASRLEDGLAAHGIHLQIVRYTGFGSWDANTRARAGLAVNEVESHGDVNHGFHWLMDADIEVSGNPKALFRAVPQRADIAVCRRHDKASKDPGFAVAAGLVGWGGAVGMAFLRDWARRCNAWTPEAEESRSTAAPPEQACFAAAVRNAEAHGAHVVEIPPEYHATQEDLPHLWFPAIFINLCASRTMRKVVS